MIYLNCTTMHGLTNLKFTKIIIFSRVIFDYQDYNLVVCKNTYFGRSKQTFRSN